MSENLRQARVPELLLMLCVAASAGAAAPAPNYHALLVGVSAYDNLDESRHLLGPTNDVILVRDALRARGFRDDHILVLADDLQGAMPPTKARVMRAFDTIVKRSKSGDFVYLHFSGHGSQQPAGAPLESGRNHGEPDALDEIFLPRDVGHWDGGIGQVVNALTDDEVDAFIAALRNQQVFVWAVFDSCHSGTMTRSVPVIGERERRIDPVELGIDREVRDRVVQAQEDMSRLKEGRPPDETVLEGQQTAIADRAAAYVAFYASQSNETTPELRLPHGDPSRRQHGLFTFTLMQVLAQYPDITYRQAAQELLGRYAAMNRDQPTPLFEGSGLDARMFGAEAGTFKAQWRVTVQDNRLLVQAGRLHEIEPGSILALLAHPAATDEEAIGYVEVDTADLSRSVAEPTTFRNNSAIDLAEIPPTAYARMMQRSLSLRLRVARPPHGREQEFLQALADEDSSLIEFVDPGNPADVRLALQDGRLWFLPPSGELVESGPSATPSMHTSADDDAANRELARDYLRRIAKVTNLLRLATTSSTVDQDVHISLAVQSAGAGAYVEISPATRPVLHDGDVIRLKIDNSSRSAQDVTLLFVDSAWGITPVFPARPGDSNRIEPRGAHDVFATVTSHTTAGMERVIGIATSAMPNVPHTDFSFLVQERIPNDQAARGMTTGLYRLLVKAGFEGGRTRGLTSLVSEQTVIRTFAWKTEPCHEC